MTSLAESALVFGAVVCATLLGAAISRFLPERHTGDDTRAHGVISVAIVSTIAALVLSLAISNANTTRIATRQDVTVLAANIVRIDSLLRKYGGEADQARTALRRYATDKLEDLFPAKSGKPGNLSNVATAEVLDQMQDDVAQLQPGNDIQRWRRSLALDLSNQITLVNWTMAQRDEPEVSPAGIEVLAFWLAILFGTYGLFMPRNGTAAAISVLSALAVALAMLLILDARHPFDGVAQISPRSLAEAVSAVQR